MAGNILTGFSGLPAVSQSLLSGMTGGGNKFMGGGSFQEGFWKGSGWGLLMAGANQFFQSKLFYGFLDRNPNFRQNIYFPIAKYIKTNQEMLENGYNGLVQFASFTQPATNGGVDTRVDLWTSKDPVTDILKAWKYRTKQSDIKLFDIVKPYPLSSHHMGWNYRKNVWFEGKYRMEVYLPDYREVNPKARAGFPIKWRRWGQNPENKTLKGFYLLTPTREIAIGITVRSEEAYEYLKKLYNDL